ncbi:Murein hydrolase activator NlpD precursor [Streptomyces sp. YIM 130001]|uniref:peptidoglycan-binding protein n=1 Tax=Streptomyces sp. YIM 130001 TaxID=2259644 RepID=UPI000E654134|nr:peptidoglycan-binding protein [Streptomyces sp. YIM 130001]RII20349.1 Murein hydrolase activator NlpD precursor [Streptomyces sp. YIM 130001]
MCATCGPADEVPLDEAEFDAAGRSGPSRRRLLMGVGAGLGLALTSAPFAMSTASAASLKNGRWCNPALGHFPDGGHYGAPRGRLPHAGQDVTNSVGTAVYAAAAGKVVRRGSGVLAGRTGNGLVLSHGGGVYTYYGHLSAFRVGADAEVSAGRRIADMGATGNVTGPHLHFEIHHDGLNATTDPVDYLSARGVGLGGGWPSLDPGASGRTVVALQHLMTKRGYELEADGAYGSASVAAVKKFQSARGLVADGQVGPRTWPVLVYALRRGASGVHVRALQVALNKRSAGLAVDGDFGSVSETAVRTYQGLNRLVADGEAGPKTWRALVA